MVELSLGLKIGLGCLAVAFIIVIVLLVYYFWQLKLTRQTDDLAAYTAVFNPAFSQKVLNMRLRCSGKIPGIETMKPGWRPTPAPLPAPAPVSR